jgi:hypothetical protein
MVFSVSPPPVLTASHALEHVYSHLFSPLSPPPTLTNLQVIVRIMNRFIGTALSVCLTFYYVVDSELFIQASVLFFVKLHTVLKVKIKTNFCEKYPSYVTVQTNLLLYLHWYRYGTGLLSLTKWEKITFLAWICRHKPISIPIVYNHLHLD